MRTTLLLPVAATMGRLLAGSLLVGALLSGCGATGDDAARAGIHHFGRIAFDPCSLTGATAGKPTEAQCGTFEVAEDPARPDGRRIALNIAWLPANGGNGGGTDDPVFFLAGGPGQAATKHAAAAEATLAEVNKQRDIILIDQRGTGQSNPLDCLDASGEPMLMNDIAATAVEEVAAFGRQCAQSLEGRTDPRFYATADAVRDLDAVRAALGVERINLLGVSYGTRVAQQYAMAYPRHTRSLVLDGIVPNDLVIGGEFARTFEDALALQSQQCQAVPECRERFPTDLRVQLGEVMSALEAAPVEVDYRDSRTGEFKRDSVDADAVGSLALMFSYVPQTASLLPLVIDEAAQGRYAALMSLLEMAGTQMDGQMTRGMQWSVVCTEDADRYQPDPAAADTLLGGQLGEAFFAPCKAWPHKDAAADFHRPFESDLPVLLLSGELDPVTPPRYGERVANGLPNGRHLMLRGQGHNVSLVGCMPKLLGKFMEEGDAEALDTTCLDTLSYVPPFLDFNGWSP